KKKQKNKKKKNHSFPSLSRGISPHPNHFQNLSRWQRHSHSFFQAPSGLGIPKFVTSFSKYPHFFKPPLGLASLKLLTFPFEPSYFQNILLKGHVPTSHSSPVAPSQPIAHSVAPSQPDLPGGSVTANSLSGGSVTARFSLVAPSQPDFP